MPKFLPTLVASPGPRGNPNEPTHFSFRISLHTLSMYVIGCQLLLNVPLGAIGGRRHLDLPPISLLPPTSNLYFCPLPSTSNLPFYLLPPTSNLPFYLPLWGVILMWWRGLKRGRRRPLLRGPVRLCRVGVRRPLGPSTPPSSLVKDVYR